MGSIHPYTSKAGRRYLVRYRKPDGSQASKRGFTRKREAEVWLADIEAHRARGQYVDPRSSRATIGDLGPAWLAAKRASLKPSSFGPVEAAWRLRVEPQWGGWRVGDIHFTDVKAWVSKLSQESGPTVVIRTFGVLASILDDAVNDARISRNPARIGAVGLPKKTSGLHTYLTHEQVLALARASGQQKLLVLTLAYTGIRWAEATGLRARDIHPTKNRVLLSRNAVEVHGTVHVGTLKSNKARIVPVPGFLITELRGRIEGAPPDSLVFPGPDGTFMRRTRASDGSRSWFKSALRDASIPAMTLHDLRHTAASLAVQTGANVKTIQRMLGHASAAMTLDVYADLFDSDLDTVSSALDGQAVRVGARQLFDETPP